MGFADHLSEASTKIAETLISELSDHIGNYRKHVGIVAHAVDALIRLETADAILCAHVRKSKAEIQMLTQLHVITTLEFGCQQVDSSDESYDTFRWLYRTFPYIRDATRVYDEQTIICVAKYGERASLSPSKMTAAITDEDRATAALATEPLRYVGNTQEQQAA